MLTDAQAVAASQAVADLQEEILRASAVVETSWDLFSEGTAKTAARAALRDLLVRVERLGTVVLDRVGAGEMPWERWVETAHEYHRAAIAYSSGSEDWKFSAVLWNTAAATAGDLVEAAKDAKPWGAGVLVVAGLIAVAIIVTRVKA